VKRSLKRLETVRVDRRDPIVAVPVFPEECMSDPVTRLNAALEGRYRIERQLGEGGMATVYLAKDLKHNRNVALKVLKPELAAVVGADRFLAEIETTANLQHPHILPLFDSGEADSFLFYVMPYVEGESLRDRLDRDKQLPVDEAVRVATAVANALHAAHDKGVIHRDIKPANILLSGGEPLVADFGIALAVGVAGGSRLTETGLSLGTPHYMSPEQATGEQTVGPAADIYALGCVLYEMLVGDPPHTGSSAQVILGKIITGDPVSAKKTRSSVPANVDATIQKALERLPADRISSAQRFAQALADPDFAHGAGPPRGGARNRSTLLAASVAAVSAFALAWAVLGRQSSRTAMVSRYHLNLGQPPQLAQRHASRVTISPDGSHFVFVGPLTGYQLWTRQRDELEPTSLAGTEGGYNPAFSPDGERVAFLVGTPAEALRVVSLSGEPPVEILRGELNGMLNRLGHTWGSDGHIYVGSDEGLVRVEEGGGSLQSVTRIDADAGETGHVAPIALPGGRGVLFTVLGTPSTDVSRYQIAVANPGTGDYEVLVPGVRVRYSTTGHLVYVSAEGTLLAVPFDEDRLEVTGASVALSDGVMVAELGSLDMDLSSAGGSLVYGRGTLQSEGELMYVGRDGSARAVDPGWTEKFNALALSPGGDRLAFAIQGPTGSDVWVKQLDGGSPLRLSFEGLRNMRPEWTPDGQWVSYGSDRLALIDVWMRRADGGGDEQLVLDRERGVAELVWSPDGSRLVYRTDGGTAGGGDILMLPADASGEPTVLLGSPYLENSPALSPRGDWLAYVSTETGSAEVYVVPFPEVQAQKSRISISGGTEPVWAHSGRELFYRSGDGDMVSVAVSTTPTFDHGEQRVLFSALPYRTLRAHRMYDVMPDDERFIMVRATTSGPVGDLVVVEGFSEELRQPHSVFGVFLGVRVSWF
jgi:serine/threonine-protein kinase